MNARRLWIVFVFAFWAWMLSKAVVAEHRYRRWNRGVQYVSSHRASKKDRPPRRRDGNGRHKHPTPVVIGLFAPKLEKRLTIHSA